MVVKLKANVSILEGQVDSLKADLTEVRRSQSLSSADRESLSGFEHSQTASRQPDKADMEHDPRLSFSYVYRRNKTRDWVPFMCLADTADDETSQGVDAQEGASTRSVFKSPERRCYHCCTVATSNRKPEDHHVHVHVTDGVSSSSGSEGTIPCNGSTESETTAQSSSDILNDTLSELVESNSDTSGRILDVKVSTTVRCRKHIDVSAADGLKRSSGSVGAPEAVRLSKTSSTTQTDSDTLVNGRCVIAN